MKLLVLNGPNMNLLGIREPELYGTGSYKALCEKITAHCKEKDIEVTFFQSNHEGELIDAIQAAYGRMDGIVINPAAYTHTSIAIADALRAVALPAVEVHLTDVNAREEYRRISYTKDACIAVISGRGFDGYCDAIDLLLTAAQEKKL